jgi:hypothetical protein
LDAAPSIVTVSLVTALLPRMSRAVAEGRIPDLRADLSRALRISGVAEGNGEGAALLASLKRDPGAVGLDSLLMEIIKPTAVWQLGLPEGLFADCSEKLVAARRARAIKMYPSGFRDANEDVRITRLLAALYSSRQAEITDASVELLVALVHKINARTERRAEKELTTELKKVRGKEGILFKFADAAIGKPDEVVRTALYPVVGEKTLRDWSRRRRRTTDTIRARRTRSERGQPERPTPSGAFD